MKFLGIVPVYTLIIMFCLLFSFNYILKQNKLRSFANQDKLETSLIIITITAIIGARMYYVLFSWEYYKDNLIEILQIWNGGIAIYGAILAGSFSTVNQAHKLKLNSLILFDLFAPPLLISQGLGRWGNFFNHEAFGRIVSRSQLEKMFIPDFIINNMYIDGNYRMPTFLFESVFNIFGGLFLIYLYKKNKQKKKHGLIISMYLIYYGIVRVIVEPMRADSLMFFDIRISQLVSVILIITGFNLLVITNSRKKVKKWQQKN